MKKIIPIKWKVAVAAFLKDIKFFDLSVAAERLKSNMCTKKGTKKYKDAMLAKHRAIKKYLNNNYASFIKGPVLESPKEKKDPVVWVMWWQGVDKAPASIKQCIRSLQKHVKNAKVNIITENNFKEYIDVPEYIMNKLYEHNISITHFSDYLRISLLEKYGGIWFDASLYCVKDIPEKWFEMPLFSRKLISDDVTFVSDYRWTVGLLGGQAHHALFQVVKDLFEQYLKQEEEIIDYFLLDYLICMAYEHIGSVQCEIDKIPVNNSNWMFMEDYWNKEYCNDKYQLLLDKYDDTYILYVSWKADRNLLSENGKDTFYKCFLEGKM